jgi:hypothetical protein
MGASATLERVDGRDALSVESGVAYRRDVRLQDGSIDFDVQLTRRRSFVYVMFRMADDRGYEEIYLRPHKSSLPDAVQYAPVYQARAPDSSDVGRRQYSAGPVRSHRLGSVVVLGQVEVVGSAHQAQILGRVPAAHAEGVKVVILEPVALRAATMLRARRELHLVAGWSERLDDEPRGADSARTEFRPA